MKSCTDVQDRVPSSAACDQRSERRVDERPLMFLEADIQMFAAAFASFDLRASHFPDGVRWRECSFYCNFCDLLTVTSVSFRMLLALVSQDQVFFIPHR